MDIVEEMRGFAEDHEPDGWPAVRMRQITALCDEIDRLRKGKGYMPLMDTPLAIRFDALDEAQAVKNHGQTLDRLRQRGGLNLSEAAAVKGKRVWRAMTATDALRALATPNAPHEGADAALSRTLPLDAVVGRQLTRNS